MKKLLKFLLSLVCLVILLIVGVITYFGLMPGLSDLFGTSKPRNLGVKYTEAEYTTYQQKAKSEIVFSDTPTTDGKSLSVSGKTEVSSTFSQEEMSARLAHSKWKNMPVSNSQLRVNDDGSVEFSANLVMNRFAGFVSQVGGVEVSQEDVKEAFKYLDIVSNNPPVYLKFTASATNNKSNVSVESFQIGRFNVPLSEVGGDEAVEGLVDHILSTVPGFYAESVSFSDGKMSFKGTVPEKVIVQTN